MESRNKRVLVMGGTAGIGLATAELLSDDGFAVTVTGRDPGRIARLEGRFAGAVPLDGTDRPAVAAFLRGFGAFEHLVLAFSPGAVGIGPLRTTAFDDVATAVTDKVLPYLWAVQQAEVGESVTMISATGPRAAVPGTVAISAANGAIERLVSPLAMELAPVRVNAVAPGIIDTDWWGFLSDDERRARFAGAAQQVPLGRVGTAADVARAIGYLVHADYVTSTIMPVDGGTTVA
jgi:NAD(P)-dependent dehydrogenase (short-subunit alcohol dehydrogenase family)